MVVSAHRRSRFYVRRRLLWGAAGLAGVVVGAALAYGLLLAAVDTEGKPGVAWRAKHAVGTARREAKHLKREAKQQARLAAKSIG